MIEEARENLISRRETHLDQLADKLREERVRRVIEPVLADSELVKEVSDDDVQYLLDLGLIVLGKHGPEIANPIYREIIPRQLTTITEINLARIQQPEWYIAPDGKLDVSRLINAFQKFFREHSEHWIERFDYKEAGPQLLLQAFLQRVINRGGRIEREYGLGRMRTDLLIIWPWQNSCQRVVIELKILRGSMQKTMKAGLKQTAAYMERCHSVDGHLIIFDRRESISWAEKIFHRREYYQDYPISVWGC